MISNILNTHPPNFCIFPSTKKLIFNVTSISEEYFQVLQVDGENGHRTVHVRCHVVEASEREQEHVFKQGSEGR